MSILDVKEKENITEIQWCDNKFMNISPAPHEDKFTIGDKYYKYENIDALITALQKAKELWGS